MTLVLLRHPNIPSRWVTHTPYETSYDLSMLSRHDEMLNGRWRVYNNKLKRNSFRFTVSRDVDASFSSRMQTMKVNFEWGGFAQDGELGGSKALRFSLSWIAREIVQFFSCSPSRHIFEKLGKFESDVMLRFLFDILNFLKISEFKLIKSDQKGRKNYL